MSTDELPMEPVASVGQASTSERTGGRYRPSTIYQIELAMLAMRCESLERELERERFRHERVVDQYEQLLADRMEAVTDADGPTSGASVTHSEDVKKRLSSVLP